MFILWGAAFAGSDKIGGFDLRQTLTYFVTLLVLQFFISAFNEDYQISEEIRNGLINQFLLKPINYFGYRFSIFVAARLVSGALILLPLLVAMPVLKDYLTFPTDGWRFMRRRPGARHVGAHPVQHRLLLRMLTFWFTEIQGFVILSMAIESVLADRFSRWICCRVDLPHRAVPAVLLQMYFRARSSRGGLACRGLRSLVIQAGWVGVLLVVGRILWLRGLRRHTAVGG